MVTQPKHNPTRNVFGLKAVRRESGKGIAFLTLYVVIVALSAAFLGGDEAGWGEVIPVIGIGLLFLFCPPRTLPNRVVLLGLLGLMICGLLGFLPSRWFGEPGWHQAVRQAVPGLVDTVSLQPWNSFLRFGVMLSVILFAVWVIQWRPRNRVYGLKLLTCGIALVATIAIAASVYGVAVPGWHPPQGFGPFANRNQTGTLMALGAMLALGLLASAARRRHWIGLLWTSTFFVCLAALLLSNSRAPFCLLAVGCLAWFFGRLKLSVFSARGLAIAGGLMLLMATGALIIGEGVAKRLPELLTSGAGFRAKIYHDALQLASKAPIEGVGIGNFEAIFPLFRDQSLNTERVIHPESDWLWLVSELGWLSAGFGAITVGGIFWRRTQPGTKGEKDILLAGLIAMAAFLVNSLFDVPGHRLGTMLPILVVCGICTQARRQGEGWAAISWLSRLLGIGLVAFGLVLFQENQVKSRFQRALSRRDWARIEATASDSLLRTPLNWSLYVQRGYANVYQHQWLPAITDFRSALLLEPKLPILPFNEGRAWVGLNPELAVAVWKQCLQRSLNAERNDFYRQMLGASYTDARLHEAILRLSDDDVPLAVMALQCGHADAKTLKFLEEEKSNLDSEQSRAVSRWQARDAAIRKDFQEAYELGRQGMKPVVFPDEQPLSEKQCRFALIRDHTDMAAAFSLCSILQSEERWEEALQILETLVRGPKCPGYFRVMRAEILASKNEWQEAWAAISGLVQK
jgi:O-antigen ligase/tetratricopeptide (TPR) repeat protein